MAEGRGAAAVKSVTTAEAVSRVETVEAQAQETLSMSIDTHIPAPTHAPSHADGHKSPTSAILRLALVIVLGLTAVFLLVEATKEGSVVGTVIMGLVLAAVGVSVPFLLSDWRLTRER